MCWLEFCTFILIRLLLKHIFANMFYFSVYVFEFLSYIKFSIYLDECFQNLFRIISKFNFQVQLKTIHCLAYWHVQGIYKRMVQFQKLIKNVFLTLTQHTLSAAGIV
jgi:hypothetical protein